MAPKDFTDGPDQSLDDSCRSLLSLESQENTRPRRNQQLHVSFASHCHFRVYPMPSSRTKGRTWYSDVDYAGFRSTTKTIAQAAESGETVEGEDMLLGINSLSRAQAECRTKRRVDVWDVVLDGQDCGLSPDVIAVQCTRLSHSSVQESELAAALLAISIGQKSVLRLRSKKDKASGLISNQPIHRNTRAMIATIS